MQLARPLALAALACLTGCNLDGLLLTELTRGDNRAVPDAAPQTLTGTLSGGGGARVRVIAGDARPIGPPPATATATGAFALEFSGTVALSNAIAQGQLGRREWLAIIPELPAQTSVLAPARTFAMSALSPGAAQVDDVTTAMSLLLVAKLRQGGKTLASAPPSAVSETLIDVHKKLVKGDPSLALVAAMVARIRAQAPATAAADAAGSYQLAGAGSLLQAGLLAAAPIDIDGDGAPDATSAPFDAAIAQALAAFTIKACYEPDRIRVVVQTRFVGAGGKDGNCDPTFNPYLWTDKAANKVVFITGGVHVDTLRCPGAAGPNCLTQAQVDGANAALGNWVPNMVRMYDDGSHGDGQGGDGVWTASFDLPYIEPAAGVAPVRIAYKFTYGQPGQGWTDSEEFPGNQRILELVDVDGDRIVTRFDLFADETTNKDKKNANTAGCGEVLWTGVDKAGCLHDVRERPVDLDGDCTVDGWPSAGTAAPITRPCPK